MATFRQSSDNTGVSGWSKPYSGLMSGKGGGTGKGGGLLGKGPTAAPAGQFFGTPATTFPQYTSGAWANLPTGTIGAPQQPPPTPTPQPPASQTPNSPLGGLFGSAGIEDLRNKLNAGFDLRAFLASLGMHI